MDGSIWGFAIVLVFVAGAAFSVGFRLGRSNGEMVGGEIDIAALGRWATLLVKAAEQMLRDQPGAQKLKWVLDQILSLPQFGGLKESEVRPVIEAAVHDLRKDKLEL